MNLKVLSWNIWVSGSLEKWVSYLQIAKADIIGLQEVKKDDPDRDIIRVLNKLGYQHFFAETKQIWNGKTYHHGPAIFSKLPIVHTQKIQLEQGDGERAAAYVQVDVNGEILHVLNTHLVHTHQQPSSQQEAQTKKLIASLPSSKVIVMGDFNATPESATIQAMNKILVDTDSAALPTWSVYPEGCEICHPQTIDTKLDYIFVSKDLRTSSFTVDHIDASDHLPISVKVGIGAGLVV